MDFVSINIMDQVNRALNPPHRRYMHWNAFGLPTFHPRVPSNSTRNENNAIEFPPAIEENHYVERYQQGNESNYEDNPAPENCGYRVIKYPENTTGQPSTEIKAKAENRIIEQLRKYIINPNSLREFGFPTKCEKNQNRTYILKSVPGLSGTTASPEKECARCQQKFIATRSGQYLTQENCKFHSGKLSRELRYGRATMKYTCCRGDKYSTGCFVQDRHVWSGIAVGLNGPFYDYVETQPKCSAYAKNEVSPLVLVLDCEMCYTAIGLECAEVSIVNLEGELIYRTLVRPKLKIEDYNTQYSGLTPDNFWLSGNMKTLEEVQHDLLKLISADTILIGHGLENDLRVLKIIHKTIIDTSILYEHDSGFPFKYSLRNLANQYLQRDIQSSDEGHSSLEDCRAALDLVLSKARQETNVRNQFCNRFN